MAILWELLETQWTNASFPMEVSRARVPGGWLVAVHAKANPLVTPSEIATSVTFYPDPGHEWDGSSGGADGQP